MSSRSPRKAASSPPTSWWSQTRTAPEFYRSLFDGLVLFERDPVVMKVANSWLILNEPGGPTDDKPGVTLETPPDPNRTSAFLDVRVADIAKAYREWAAKGAQFLTSPKTTAGRSAPTSATQMDTWSRWVSWSCPPLRRAPYAHPML